MKTLTVRNIPDDLYERLAGLARSNRRSLQQQILMLFEQVRWQHGDDPLASARAMRDQLADRKLGDTVADLRQERAR